MRLQTPVRHQPERMGCDVVPIFNMPMVDAVAAKDPEHGDLTISLINHDAERIIPVEIRLEHFVPQNESASVSLRRTRRLGRARRHRASRRNVYGDAAAPLGLPPQAASSGRGAGRTMSLP